MPETHYLCRLFKKVLMNSRREYELAFVGLKPGIHEYDYKITDRFFEAYQQQDFTNCDAEVKLFLEKNLGFMLLRFEVTGTVKYFVIVVEIPCRWISGMNSR